MKKTIRLDYIDVYKGIGILLMVMGHIEFGDKFDYWIHGFHMPMFFFVTGYLYKESNNFLLFFIKKFKSLIMPYFFFSLIHLFLFFLVTGVYLEQIIAILLYSNTDNMPISGALWFLQSLFFSNMIFYWINKYRSYNKLIIVLILIIFGLTINYNFNLPFSLNSSLIGIGLMYAGNSFKHLNLDKKGNIKSNIFLFIIGSILIMLNGYVNMRSGEYSNPIIFYVASIIMSISILNTCINIKVNSLIFIKVLKVFGKESLIYLSLNQIVILALNKILSLNVVSWLNNIVLIKLFLLVFTMFALFILSRIFNRTALKKLIGKPKV